MPDSLPSLEPCSSSSGSFQEGEFRHREEEEQKAVQLRVGQDTGVLGGGGVEEAEDDDERMHEALLSEDVLGGEYSGGAGGLGGGVGGVSS